MSGSGAVHRKSFCGQRPLPFFVTTCSRICYALLSRAVHCGRERRSNNGKQRRIEDVGNQRTTHYQLTPHGYERQRKETHDVIHK
jgi:hypothetical protein